MSGRKQIHPRHAVLKIVVPALLCRCQPVSNSYCSEVACVQTYTAYQMLFLPSQKHAGVCLPRDHPQSSLGFLIRPRQCSTDFLGLAGARKLNNQERSVTILIENPDFGASRDPKCISRVRGYDFGLAHSHTKAYLALQVLDFEICNKIVIGH